MVVDIQQDGFRRALVDGQVIACEDPDDVRICFDYVKRIRSFGWRHGTVAHIGTGFSVTAWMLGPEFDHAMFDLHDFSAYLPGFVPLDRMVVGDYRDTLVASYDILIFDYATPLNRPLLEAHLRPGGLLIIGAPGV